MLISFRSSIWIMPARYCRKTVSIGSHLTVTGSFTRRPTPTPAPKISIRLSMMSGSWDAIPVPSRRNIYGIQKDGSQKYGTPIYVNQPVIFQHSVKVDDWRGGVMRTPPANWTTYKDRNEVGYSAVISKSRRTGTDAKSLSPSMVSIHSSICGSTVST